MNKNKAILLWESASLFLVRFLSRCMAIWFLFIETTPKCLHRCEHFVTLAAVEQAKVNSK